MRILSFLAFSLFILTSCKSVEDVNPLNGMDGKSDESLNSETTEQYIQLINNYRQSIGLKALIFEAKMSAVATTHSQNMASGKVGFGHTGFSERCNKAREIMGSGNLCGEIVAQGQTTAEKVFASWMSSLGHRAKIEEGRYTHTGFGYFKSAAGTTYWTQVFLEVN